MDHGTDHGDDGPIRRLASLYRRPVSDDERGRALHLALAQVAGAAVYLRQVTRADVGEHGPMLTGWAWEQLMQALDQLESAEPGVHLDLTEKADRGIAQFRRDVGLDRSGGGEP